MTVCMYLYVLDILFYGNYKFIKFETNLEGHSIKSVTPVDTYVIPNILVDNIINILSVTVVYALVSASPCPQENVLSLVAEGIVLVHSFHVWPLLYLKWTGYCRLKTKSCWSAIKKLWYMSCNCMIIFFNLKKKTVWVFRLPF